VQLGRGGRGLERGERLREGAGKRAEGGGWEGDV
jgi:hypothetical protein